MSPEFNSDQKVEKSELTHKEKALRKIEEHIKDTGLDSPRFQAFADHADFVNAEALLKRNKDYWVFQMRYSLIDETIRKRKNGVIGYKKEYQKAEELRIELEKAMRIDREKGENKTDSSTYFLYIKNDVIDKRGGNLRS